MGNKETVWRDPFGDIVEPNDTLTRILNEPEDTSPMAQTIRLAHFEYNGHTVTARRMIDDKGTFYLWQGRFDGSDIVWVIARTLEKFEQEFRRIADAVDADEATNND